MMVIEPRFFFVLAKHSTNSFIISNLLSGFDGFLFFSFLILEQDVTT